MRPSPSCPLHQSAAAHPPDRLHRPHAHAHTCAFGQEVSIYHISLSNPICSYNGGRTAEAFLEFLQAKIQADAGFAKVGERGRLAWPACVLLCIMHVVLHGNLAVPHAVLCFPCAYKKLAKNRSSFGVASAPGPRPRWETKRNGLRYKEVEPKKSSPQPQPQPGRRL